MCSTLPRTKSLGVCDTFSLSRSKKSKNERPSSLCESSVNGIQLKNDPFFERIRRTPSQTNNLSTTVPTSLVNKKLGGRHVPTKNSLRHSRMAVLARRGEIGHILTKKRSQKQIFICIAVSYLFVGVLSCLLAGGFVYAVPSLPFTEIPHYAGGAIIFSGLFSTLVINCLSRDRRKVFKIFKILSSFTLITSIACCICVCFHNCMHLIELAPLECGMSEDVVFHSQQIRDSSQQNSQIQIFTESSGISVEISENSIEINTIEPQTTLDAIFKSNKNNKTIESQKSSTEKVSNDSSTVEFDYKSNQVHSNETENLLSSQIFNEKFDEFDETSEGSGFGMLVNSDDEDYDIYKSNTYTDNFENNHTNNKNNYTNKINRSQESESIQLKRHEINHTAGVCLCFIRNESWKIAKQYTNLNCEEVKNILPIFLVASCVLMSAGVVLSCVLIYMVVVFDKCYYNVCTANTLKAEAKPFMVENRSNNANIISNSFCHS